MSPVVFGGKNGGISVGRHIQGRAISGEPFWLMAQEPLPSGKVITVDMSREERDQLVKALQDLG